MFELCSNYVRFDVLIWGIVPHDDVLCKFWRFSWCFCLDPGYILRPGYRGHWSLVDITYYIMLCQLCHIIKKVCNIFYTLYIIYTLFFQRGWSSWCTHLKTQMRLNIYLYVFCLVFFVLVWSGQFLRPHSIHQRKLLTPAVDVVLNVLKISLCKK